LKLSPLLAFLVPMILLYLLDPAGPITELNARDSFELMWKGSTFQLFFVWLIALELILDWEKLQTSKITKLFSARTLTFITTLLLPTVYVIVSNYCGLNNSIANLAMQSGIQWWGYMPLAVEYLVFAGFYGLIVFLPFGVKGLKTFSVPLFFLIAVGAIFAIDNVYPYGQFTPFQLLVPTTTMLAAGILEIMGYHTSVYSVGDMPNLTVTDPNTLRSATFQVAWPCAGIESLLIFTVVVLLFLKRMPISWKAKIGYFAVGAVVTYVINILRIATIVRIGINGDWKMFHDFYGPLYSIAWIISYPMIILGSQILWSKLKRSRTRSMEPQPLQPNPA